MIYDKTTEYEECIAPQVLKLKKLCIKHNIPLFFATCVKNSETDSTYVKDIYSGLAKGLDLKTDYFPDFVKVTLGFETKFPSKKIEICPEDFTEIGFTLSDEFIEPNIVEEVISNE